MGVSSSVEYAVSKPPHLRRRRLRRGASAYALQPTSTRPVTRVLFGLMRSRPLTEAGPPAMLVTVGTQGRREELAPLLSSIRHYQGGAAVRAPGAPHTGRALTAGGRDTGHSRGSASSGSPAPTQASRRTRTNSSAPSARSACGPTPPPGPPTPRAAPLLGALKSSLNACTARPHSAPRPLLPRPAP